MPRVARGLGDKCIYHVLNRGNGRQAFFHKHSDYEAFINLMKQAKQRHSVKIFAYCLMHNPYHRFFIMRTSKG
jgi:putative transposase